MTLAVTQATRQSLQKIKKEPSLVVLFDGITEVFGSAQAFRYVKFDDVGRKFDGTWRFDDRVAVPSQITAITFDGTSTKIDYKLNPDLAVGESVTSFSVACVDNRAAEIVTLLGTEEFLGRKCRILLSPDSTDTVYPDDYVTIFRGIVDDITLETGKVIFTISHPDQKKRQTIYTSYEAELAEALDASETSIDITGDSGLPKLFKPITGPDSLVDGDFKSYIRVNDEIIRFTGVSGTTLTGCTRGALGTTAATHSLGDAVKSFYHFDGNCIDIALKIMLSGWNGSFATGVEADAFNVLSSSESVANSIFFAGINVEDQYGLTAGDYVTTTGAANGSNNVTAKVISEVVVTGTGSYIVVDGVTFTDETDTAAVAAFRSKYDTFPEGLKMSPDEVDVAQHERLRDLFLSSVNYSLYVKDTIDSAKEFISKELYKPIAAYAVPRKARASLAYTIGPLPTDTVITINTSNVLNANRLSKKRSLGRNFYNTIIYKLDQAALTDDFLQGVISTDNDSRTDIPVGTRALTIESKGLRDTNRATSAATRRLNRYAFGADYINNIQLTFDAGYLLEVADLVIIDGESLQLADSREGVTATEQRLYEIVSKSFDLITGRVTIGVTNTNFANAGRYGLISPASYIKTGNSASAFIIESSFSSVYGNDEFLKWTRYGQPFIRVRNSDYTTAATAQVERFSGNLIVLQQSLGFTPSAGMLMELSDYNQATDQIKLLYTHITNGSAAFDDGKPAYFMI